MENGRVVELTLEEFGLTGAVPAEVGRLSALRELRLGRQSADGACRSGDYGLARAA